MHYASAIFYGGQLIDAADADYDSYKDLGLLCPHCKEPVFLQTASQRQGSVTLIQIPAHFKHFKAKDPVLVKECEARVARYDAKEVERRVSQARNQRLRLLQRRFWDILTDYYESELDPPFDITKILESLENNFITQIGRTFSNKFLVENLDDSKHWTRQFVEAGFTGGHILISWSRNSPNAGVIPSAAIQHHFRESLSGKLDRQMQELIACEVLDFLHSKSARPLVEKLFALACYVLLDAMADGVRLGLTGIDGTAVAQRYADGRSSVNPRFWDIPGNQVVFYHYAFSHVCLWVAMLPWARQMNH